jgi:hypothetical protein
MHRWRGIGEVETDAHRRTQHVHFGGPGLQHGGRRISVGPDEAAGAEPGPAEVAGDDFDFDTAQQATRVLKKY